METKAFESLLSRSQAPTGVQAQRAGPIGEMAKTGGLCQSQKPMYFHRTIAFRISLLSNVKDPISGISISRNFHGHEESLLVERRANKRKQTREREERTQQEGREEMRRRDRKNPSNKNQGLSDLFSHRIRIRVYQTCSPIE